LDSSRAYTAIFVDIFNRPIHNLRIYNTYRRRIL
jgi:hypothetical protein